VLFIFVRRQLIEGVGSEEKKPKRKLTQEVITWAALPPPAHPSANPCAKGTIRGAVSVVLPVNCSFDPLLVLTRMMTSLLLNSSVSHESTLNSRHNKIFGYTLFSATPSVHTDQADTRQCMVQKKRRHRRATHGCARCAHARICTSILVALRARTIVESAVGYKILSYHLYTSGKQGFSPSSFGASVPVAQPGLTNRD
jgi:hypothetical protein